MADNDKKFTLPPVVINKLAPTHKARVMNQLNRKRRGIGAPKSTIVNGVKTYTIDPQPLSKLNVDDELKNRSKILKALVNLEKEKESGENIVFCHLSGAVLLCNTTLLHIEDIKIVQTTLFAIWKVKIRGVREMIMQEGGDEEEAERLAWYSLPSFLGELAESYLAPNLHKTWNCVCVSSISAVDSTFKNDVAVAGVGSPSPIFEEKGGSQQRNVYTTLSFMYDDGTVQLSAELLPFESKERHAPTPPKQSHKRKEPPPPPSSLDENISPPTVKLAKRSRRTIAPTPKESMEIAAAAAMEQDEGEVCAQTSPI